MSKTSGRNRKNKGGYSDPLFKTWALWAAAGASVIGIVLGLYTTLKTLGVNTALTRAVGCTISDVLDCDPVLASDYALMLGIPVAAWGMIFYIFTLAVALLALFVANRNLTGTLVAVAFVLSALGVLFSCYKAYQLYVLGYVCPFCVGMYGVNIALLILFWMAPLERNSVVSYLKDVVTGQPENLKFQPSLGPALGLVVVIFLSGFMVMRGIQDGREANQPANQETLVGLFTQHFESRKFDVPMADDTPMKGNPDAPVTMHVFSDFQCPGCKQASEVVEMLYAENPDKIKVYYMHYPLDIDYNPRLQAQIHPFAGEAATASMCAQERGDFWGYHDKLFAGQALIGMDYLTQLAGEMGWDQGEFAACMTDSLNVQRVKDDLDRGQNVGVNQTPSIYTNGRLVHSQYWSNIDLHRMIISEEIRLAEEGAGS